MRIVTFGDSVTHAVRAGVSEEETFSALWQVTLNKAGHDVEILKRGVPGENTTAALLRLDEGIALEPQLMTIMYGLNDAAIDAGQEAPRVPLQTYKANLLSLIDRLQAASIQPVLLTPNPMAAFGITEELYASRPPYDSRGINFMAEQYAATVRRVGQLANVPVIDVWQKFTGELDSLENYLLDGMHSNPKGQQVIADLLVQHSEGLLSTLQTQVKQP